MSFFLSPGTSLKGEMIPFLLRACPRLKSLGHGGSIPYGLELFAALQVVRIRQNPTCYDYRFLLDIMEYTRECCGAGLFSVGSCSRKFNPVCLEAGS